MMSSSVRASRADVTLLRLRRHGLTGRGLGDPVAVVERMLALQAQDYAAGRWALGVRSPGTTDAQVLAAITAGTIVRSWPMRGTLHFVPAADLGWMLRLTAPRLLAGARTRQAQLGLDEATIEGARHVAQQALSGGRGLTRAEFMTLLGHAGISTENQRGYHLIWHLAQTGTLCWGPHRGNQQVLVLSSEWIAHPRRMERDESLGEFVLRYFNGHGPATLRDFAWWAHVTVADAKIGLAVARDRLVELCVDGVSFYHGAETDTDSAGRPRQRRSVLALPSFDEWLLGYTDRSFAIENERQHLVVPGKNGIFLPVLVSGGRVVGTWRKHVSARTVLVTPHPFVDLSERQQAGLDRGIRDVGLFLGLDASRPPPDSTAT